MIASKYLQRESALSLLPRYLKNSACFDALVGSAPVEKLKEIKKTASPDEQKLAIRILEEVASKSKALVTPRAS